MNARLNIGLLSCFVVMLAASRSFLSSTIHEFFKRILYYVIGIDV